MIKIKQTLKTRIYKITNTFNTLLTFHILLILDYLLRKINWTLTDEMHCISARTLVCADVLMCFVEC